MESFEIEKESRVALSCTLDYDRRAKIVATIGPSSSSKETLRALIQSGVDVARLNMSHGSYEKHSEAIANIRSLSAELDRPVAILLDLSGPKIRTGRLKNGKPIELVAGNSIIITTETIEGDEKRVSANYPYLTQDVRVKDRLLLDDGLIELIVEDKTPTELYCRVLHGGSLGEHKGINLPGTPLSIPSITDKDRCDLEFGIQQGVDYVALSFVRSAKDCIDAKQLIEHTANKVGAEKVPLIAKIEKAEALRELDAILEIADGIMVARGDLGIETSTESVPVHQKEMIRKANLIGKPVITATQMLQSMIENPRPTRAEASDVANAILDGTDAVMLSGETASGAFPVEAVKTMDRIVRFTEAAVERNIIGRTDRTISAISQHTGSYNRALAEAAVFAADEIGSPIILVFTEGGKMARRVSALRPKQKIIAFTYVQHTYRRMAAVWGIKSYLMDIKQASDQLLTHADQMLLRLQIAPKGTTIVMVAGNLSGIPASNIVKLHRVGDFVQER